MSGANPGGGYVETIAVYREERVKVYGITLRRGLSLATLDLAGQACGELGRCLATLPIDCHRFDLVTGQYSGDDRFQLQLLFDQISQPTLVSTLESVLNSSGIAGDEARTGLLVRTPVAVLFLHGPHFQDRYGIADVAFSALAEGEIPILLSACAGTSMYLVLSDQLAEAGMELLRRTFLIPTAV